MREQNADAIATVGDDVGYATRTDCILRMQAMLVVSKTVTVRTHESG